MTDTQDQKRERDEIVLADVFRPLGSRASHIRKGTILATFIAAALAGVYFLVQPTTRSASVEFRPLFDGASTGKYPNGLPFAPSDITAESIVNQVAAKNQIGNYCQPEIFRSGLVVEESSPELQFLNLDYQARLSDSRLTTLDRDRLQEEYENRRTALRRDYRLQFFLPRECAALPQPIVMKALTEVVETWATESERRRGVLKFRVSVLTPGVFERPGDEDSLLVRADLLRTAIGRVISNIAAVERLPGSELVRGSSRNVSFAEVRSELEDLLRARLDPLISIAGRGLGPSSLRFLQQALRSAEIRLREAQQRADAYRLALREYSGVTTAPSAAVPTGTEATQSPGDIQGLTPQIDRTFVDRIVDLSATNTAFRQEITRDAIAASIEAVERAAVVEQYRQLLDVVNRGAGTQLEEEAVASNLERITTQAKDATKRFNDIYDEFVTVALRIGGQMYRLESAEESAVRTFSLRDYAFVVIVALIATPVLLAVVFLTLYHGRRFFAAVR